MRLLVTRPEPDASALAEELRALGHEAAVQPLLEFRVLDFDPAPVIAADALIFTSGNSIRALRERPGFGYSSQSVFCVGSETERRVREGGFKNIAATAATAEELTAKILAAATKGLRLVHVTGEHQAFDLAAALSREGLSIGTLRVYGMEPRCALDSRIAGEVKAGEIGGVILMSPRTAEVFVALCRQHGLFDHTKSLHYFCLASTIADRLRPLEPVHVHVAPRPDRAALLALLPALPTPGQNLMKQDLNGKS
ncbi:MAG: uroporphyrinogen-III synthase [Rhodomicrobium sp.]